MNYYFFCAICLGFIVSCGSTGIKDYSSSNALSNSTELVVGELDFAGFGKPGAPVRLRHQMPKNIAVGQEILAQIELESETNAGLMSVTLSTNLGVSLQSQSHEYFQLVPEGKYQLDVSLIAQEVGLHYLNVHITESNEVGTPLMARALAVPVNVGNMHGSTKRHPEYKIDQLGKALIQMEAVERLKR